MLEPKKATVYNFRYGLYRQFAGYP